MSTHSEPVVGFAAMAMALKGGNPWAAQLVAAECVVDAETKDHQNWELISQAADHLWVKREIH